MDLKAELKKFFHATDQLREGHQSKYWAEERSMSENRLRKALDLPVAR